MTLANGDYTKVKEIERMNLHEFLFYLSHQKATTDFQNELNKG